jgi:hypothetical protein
MNKLKRIIQVEDLILCEREKGNKSVTCTHMDIIDHFKKQGYQIQSTNEDFIISWE